MMWNPTNLEASWETVSMSRIAVAANVWNQSLLAKHMHEGRAVDVLCCRNLEWQPNHRSLSALVALFGRRCSERNWSFFWELERLRLGPLRFQSLGPSTARPEWYRRLLLKMINNFHHLLTTPTPDPTLQRSRNAPSVVDVLTQRTITWILSLLYRSSPALK